MTLESLLETDLWHEFQKEARAEKRSTADVLAELIEEYLAYPASIFLGLKND